MGYPLRFLPKGRLAEALTPLAFDEQLRKPQLLIATKTLGAAMIKKSAHNGHCRVRSELICDSLGPVAPAVTEAPYLPAAL